MKTRSSAASTRPQAKVLTSGTQAFKKPGQLLKHAMYLRAHSRSCAVSTSADWCCVCVALGNCPLQSRSQYGSWS